MNTMRLIARLFVLAGCFAVATIVLIPATAAVSPPKQSDSDANNLHTPAEGTVEHTAILDGLRRHWQASKNPDDGKTYQGKITFRVNYLKVHHGWAWIYAEPRSSVTKERFPENSGFLLQLKSSRWEVMKLPRMDDNGDGAFNPSPGDFERIKKMYPAIAPDIIPIEKRR